MQHSAFSVFNTVSGGQVTIKHRKGVLHHVPDALSRMYEPNTKVVSTIDETDDPWY